MVENYNSRQALYNVIIHQCIFMTSFGNQDTHYPENIFKLNYSVLKHFSYNIF